MWRWAARGNSRVLEHRDHAWPTAGRQQISRSQERYLASRWARASSGGPPRPEGELGGRMLSRHGDTSVHPDLEQVGLCWWTRAPISPHTISK